MTDEEMAENFVDAFLKKDDFELDKFLDENLGNLKLTTKQAGVILGVIKGVGIGSYLAGLKAGRPQWHKVADGDLPKEQKEYWCKVFYYESEETFNAFLWFDVKTKKFKFLEDIEDGIEDSFDVKSWCELPEYKEE